MYRVCGEESTTLNAYTLSSLTIETMKKKEYFVLTIIIIILIYKNGKPRVSSALTLFFYSNFLCKQTYTSRFIFLLAGLVLFNNTSLFPSSISIFHLSYTRIFQ